MIKGFLDPASILDCDPEVFQGDTAEKNFSRLHGIDAYPVLIDFFEKCVLEESLKARVE
jgi:hypothetical protein